MRRYTPIIAGRLYQEDGLLLADYRDARDGSTTYGYLASYSPLCPICGTPEAVGCDCAHITHSCILCRYTLRDGETCPRCSDRARGVIREREG